MAKDAPQKPCFDLFLVLVNLAAHFEKRHIIVTQAKILERVARVTGRKMARSTLNRNLATLERLGYINRTKRHYRRKRTRELVMKATMFTFARHGILWIKTIRDAAEIPLGRRRVPFLGHNRKSYIASGVRGTVDKAPTARPHKGKSSPRSRGDHMAPSHRARS